MVEQQWQPSLALVENRFTVGSLVWAGVAGWPSWPAMVDDDPDVGSFFWCEVREGEWVPRPSCYHVVFFDTGSVSRSWVVDSRLRSFPGTGPELGKERSSARLRKAVSEAELAAGEDLLRRRSR